VYSILTPPGPTCNDHNSLTLDNWWPHRDKRTHGPCGLSSEVLEAQMHRDINAEGSQSITLPFPHVPSSSPSSSLSLLPFCPSPSLSRDRCHSSRGQSHPTHHVSAILADDLWIAHIALADVKARNIVGPHCTHLTLPSLTVPWSGLLKNGKGFRVTNRIARFYCVRFLPYFNLDLPAHLLTSARRVLIIVCSMLCI